MLKDNDDEEIYKEDVERERKAFEVLNELGCSNVVQGRPSQRNFSDAVDGRGHVDFGGKTTGQGRGWRLPLPCKVLNCLWQICTKIVYTDIKPQNLLYQCTGPSKFDVVLADLGDVIFMEPGQRVVWYAESYPYPFPKERKTCRHRKRKSSTMI